MGATRQKHALRKSRQKLLQWPRPRTQPEALPILEDSMEAETARMAGHNVTKNGTGNK